MGSYIKDVACFFPSNVLYNDDLQRDFPDRNVAKMGNKIGIHKRYIVGNSETALDLAEGACNKLFEKHDKAKIDFIILCTQSPDYYLPTSACILQKKLGLSKSIGAFDINQGCSGFVYGLSIAKGLIEASIASNILLVMADTYSKHINKEDLGNRLIFGDAATAILVEKSNKQQIGNFVLGTDGNGYNNLIVPNGGMRCRFNPDSEVVIGDRNDKRSDNDLYMNGSEIFYFVGKEIPLVIDETLSKNNLIKDNIDFYLFHQANEYMINFLAKKLKIKSERYYNNIEDIGNTVSSTIPIALKRSLEKGLIKKGDRVMLCGFGVGYSWGAVIIEI